MRLLSLNSILFKAETVKIIFTVTFFILPIVCSGQVSQNSLSKEALKGKVKILRYSYPRIETSRLMLDTNWYFVDSFSINGYKLKTYEIRKGEKRVVEKIEYEFDSKSNIIIERHYLGNGDEVVSTSYEYDSQNHIIAERHFDNTGNLGRLIKYSYEASNLIMKEDSIAQGVRKTVYKYFVKKKTVEKTMYSANEEDGMSRDLYDDKGNLISEIWLRPTYINRTFIYDRYGNEVRKEFRGPDGRVVDFNIKKYKFDKNNNWISRVERNNLGEVETLNPIIVREIEYY